MIHECQDKCSLNMSNCPSCSVAYEFIRKELFRLSYETSDVLPGKVKDILWTSPTSHLFLSIKLSRGVDTIEQLNNEIQVVFLSNRRIGLVKKGWRMNGKIENETWESIGVLEKEDCKHNKHHEISTTVFNNNFMFGFNHFVTDYIEWMHSEDYTYAQEDWQNNDNFRLSVK